MVSVGKTIKIKPRGGFILAGIPADGTDVDEDLGREWIRNGLAVEIKKERKETKPKPATPAPSEGK